MLENEGAEIESTSDVTQDSSSEGQVNTQQAQNDSVPQGKTEVPFHEHPRWKEVMEERNTERQRAQALESQLQNLQRQFQDSQKSQSKPQDPMYERLKGIDPEFADYLKEAREQAALAKQLQEELQGLRQEQFTTSAVNKFNELNKANNVSPELAKFYEAAMEREYSQGRIKTLADVEKAYATMHDGMKKYFEAQERAAIEKYTSSKKKDSSSPTGQPKGRSAVQGQKIEFSQNPQEAKAQLIKHIAQTMKAGRDQL
jgi:hypothetical protein